MEASLSPLKLSTLTLPNFDRLIRWCLFLYIFSLPFKDLFFIERNGFIVLLSFLVLWCVLNRRLCFVQTPIDVPLIVFIFWVCMTIPFATYPLYSLQEFGKLLKQFLLFYVTIFFFRERTNWIPLIWMLVGVSFVVSLYGLAQYERNNPQSMMSSLPAEVWLTTYLVMIIPLCCALAWYEERPMLKGVYVVSALLAMSCLLLTQSRAGLLSFFVELWTFAVLIRRRAMLIAAALITSVTLVAAMLVVDVVTSPDGTLHFESRTSVPLKLGTGSIVHRLDILAFMLPRIVEHPVVGIGYGKETSKMLFGQVPEEDLPPGHSPVRTHGTHNILLELSLHVGVPGALLFAWLAVCLVKSVLEGFRRATDLFAKSVLLGVGVGVCGMAVRIMFDQMLVGTMAVQFWVLVALAMLAAGSFKATAAQQDSQC